LNEYLDESTSVEIRAQLQKHINECPNCWVVVDTTKKTLSVYKGMEPQAVPDGVKSRLMAAVARKLKERQGGC
jgi:hypothetical protein